MKLSDYKGEAAIDLLADIMEPMAIILADKEIQELYNAKDEKGNRIRVAPIKYVKPMLKNHKTEVLEILARVENIPVDEYREQCNVMTLPMQILEFINDKEIQNLFTSQRQIQDN